MRKRKVNTDLPKDLPAGQRDAIESAREQHIEAIGGELNTDYVGHGYNAVPDEPMTDGLDGPMGQDVFEPPPELDEDREPPAKRRRAQARVRTMAVTQDPKKKMARKARKAQDRQAKAQQRQKRSTKR